MNKDWTHVVVTEDGEALFVAAKTADAAVEIATKEWDIETDLGFKVFTFPRTAGKGFEAVQKFVGRPA